MVVISLDKGKLDDLLDDFGEVLKRLKEAQKLSPSRIHKDATIQRFEFCFELAWKLMQSFLRYQGVECVSPRDCIRLAARMRLIDDPSEWFGYLKARNLSSHLYNQEMADEVYQVSKEFTKAAEFLLEKVNSGERSLFWQEIRKKNKE